MAFATMQCTGVSSSVKPFTSCSRPARRAERSVVRASKDARDSAAQAPTDAVNKVVGGLLAVQLAFLPAAALAEGKLAVKGALDAGQAAQEAVPKGAKDPKTREDRNTSRDKGIGSKLNTIKDRVTVKGIESNPDIEKGGKQNIFFPGSKQKAVSYDSFDMMAAPSLQVNVGTDAVANKAGEAADKAADATKSAAKDGGGLLDKIKSAAITDNSPAGQIKKLESGVAFTPSAQRSLLVFVGDTPQSGTIEQPTIRTDLDLPGNPKRGGDLKDSTTDFAAQFKGDRDEGTPGLTRDATPRSREPDRSSLPNALGGKNLLRDDNVTPEQAAEGNIAQAQQNDGNALTSIKKSLGL